LIILPTLGDRLETLRESLDSVAGQRRDIELTLVVVAPISAVVARALAAEYDAIVVDDPHVGISAAINRGIAARTSEEFYAWIGDDDLYRPGGLARLVSILDEHPDAPLAFGGCDYIDPEGRTIVVSNAGRLAPILLAWGPNLIPHPGTIIRLDLLSRVGEFDESLRFAMDLDVFLKLRSFGRFRWTREAVSAFRWHPDSLTVSSRLSSSLESEAVKRRHLPAVLRRVSALWQRPVRWASARAARTLNRRARAVVESSHKPAR
jgi:glycosyltransferase involved in cell wall biosynthesis